MSMDNQMIGRRGEKRFDTLCSDEGVTCNRSVEDDYGWDKLIEYPPRLLPFAAIDMQPGRVIAGVQVKTTTGTSRTVTLSLTNALHYARATVPQFIVLVVLEGKAARYFARHVWAPEIARWLKAGREADARGVTAVNQESVSLTFSTDDERGEDIVAWIRAEIEAVQPNYAAAKQLIVDTVGFEEGRGDARLSIVLDDRSHLMDIQLGLRPQVKAKRIVYTSKRFGILAGKPEFDDRDVILQITPEGTDCGMRIEFPEGDTVSLPAKLYSADDGQSTALRVASRALDVVYRNGGVAKATSHLDFEERVTLDEMRAFARLLSISAGEATHIAALLKGQTYDLGGITIDNARPEQTWSWVTLSLDTMKDIITNSGQRAPDLTIAEMNAAAGELEFLMALSSDRLIRIDHTPLGDIPPRFDGLLAHCSATVGEHVYSAVAQRPVKLDQTIKGRRRITFGPSRLLWGSIDNGDGWTDDAVVSAYKRNLDRLSSDGQLMALGDLAALIDRETRPRELRSDLPTGRSSPLPRLARKRRNKSSDG